MKTPQVFERVDPSAAAGLDDGEDDGIGLNERIARLEDGILKNSADIATLLRQA